MACGRWRASLLAAVLATLLLPPGGDSACMPPDGEGPSLQYALNPHFHLSQAPPEMHVLVERLGAAQLAQERARLTRVEFADGSEEAGEGYARMLALLSGEEGVFAAECAREHRGDTLGTVFAWWATGLVRTCLRREDWGTANRVLALLRRLPPTWHADSIHGTNGTMARALASLSARMQRHQRRSRERAAAFAAESARSRAARPRGGPEDDPCELTDPSRPIPGCGIRVRDSVPAAEPVQRALACSAHVCVGPHCRFRNVCVMGTEEITYFMCGGQKPPPELLPVRETPQLHTHKIKFTQGLPPSDQKFAWLRGTSLFLGAHSVLGHFVEHAVKLPALRDAFPGDIARVFLMLWYKRTGFSAPLDAACELLRIAFERENFTPPPTYNEKALGRDVLCFEELLATNGGGGGGGGGAL